jgi:hypothetical protein
MREGRIHSGGSLAQKAASCNSGEAGYSFSLESITMSDRTLELAQPSGKLDEVAHEVCTSNSPMTIKTQSGDEIRVIPVPKPVRFHKGKPVYRLEDTQFLYLDFPWLLKQ